MSSLNFSQLRKPFVLSLYTFLGGWLIYAVTENLFFYLDADLATEISYPDKFLQSGIKTDLVNGPSLQTQELFGRVDAVQQEKSVSAPTTRLNLELQGIFLSDVENGSSAIIAERGKNGELYQIGGKLPGNAVLDAIFEDYILLRRGTSIEKLLFAAGNLGLNRNGISGGRSTDRNSPARQVSQSRARDYRNPSNQMNRSNSDNQEADDLNTIRNQFLSNPTALLTKYGLQQNATDLSSGYNVATPHPALKNTGLKQGDRLVSVNGAPLGIAMNDARLIDQARTTGRVRVEVERDGRRFFLTIPVP